MPAQYEPHGRFEISRKDDLVLLDIYGPWNAELIKEAADRAWPLILDVQKTGPVGVVVSARESMLGTIEAIRTVRLETERHGKQNQMAVAWVAAPEVEGRSMMPALLQEAYDGVVVFEAFEDSASALGWIRARLDAWRKAPADLSTPSASPRGPS